MTLPKRCCVRACERRPISSSNSPPAGEIRRAKSANDNLDLAKASRTAGAPAAEDWRVSEASGSALNSATKLTQIS